MTFAAAKRRRKGPSNRAAIYTRFSSGQQHSTEDQVRACLHKAKEENLTVADGMIFSDKAISGRIIRRPTFDAMMQALADGLIDVLIFFASGRTGRRHLQFMVFIEQNVVKKKCRAIFVSQNIDTAKTNHWKMILSFTSMADELLSTQNAAHVRESLVTKVMRNEYYGQRTFRYETIVLDGLKNRLGNPRRQNVICEKEAEYVRKIIFGLQPKSSITARSHSAFLILIPTPRDR